MASEPTSTQSAPAAAAPAWVATRRTDLLNGYRYPRWLLVVGWLAWLLTLYLAVNSVRPVIQLFA
jgi:Mn2+/Fe2+ NRAMP family transporter